MADYTMRPELYGPGGGEFTDDMGQVWPDPWGTLAPPASAPPVNAAAPTAPTPASAGTTPADVSQFLGATGQNSPAPAAPAPAPTPAGGQSAGLKPGEGADLLSAPVPPPQPGRADQQASQPHPAPQPGIADQTTSKFDVATSSGSSGLAPAAQARQSQEIGQVATQQEKAAEATASAAGALEDTRFNRAKVALQGAATELDSLAAKQALNDHIQQETDRKLQAGADWRPDRAELFHGDNGVAFGLLAGVAAMAGSWMQGRFTGGQNPYLPTIIKMIDDNVADQVRKNSGTMQFLREQKGDLKAAALELKQRQLNVVTTKLQNMAIVEDHPAMQQGIAATLEAARAKNAEWEQGKRQSIERTVTSNVTKTVGQETKPNGADQRTPDQAKAQAVTDSLNSFGQKAGLQRDPKTGRWTVGPGALPPGLFEGVGKLVGMATPVHDSLESAVESYGRLMSGGAISDEERKSFRDQLGASTTTREQLASRLNAAETSLRARLREADQQRQTNTTTAPPTWK